MFKPLPLLLELGVADVPEEAVAWWSSLGGGAGLFGYVRAVAVAVVAAKDP